MLAALKPYAARMRQLDVGLWMSYQDARLQTLLHAGRYRETLAAARKLADWVREHRGDYHPWLGDVLSFVSGALYNLGRVPESDSVDREILAIYRQSLGPTHPFTVNTLNQLGTGLAQEGKYEQAVDYYRRAIEGWQAIYGKENRNISRALTNIANSQRKLGRLNEAVKTLQKAYDMEVSLLGPENPQSALTEILYGRALGEVGRLQDAQPHFKHGLARIKAAWGNSHPVVLRLRAEYARFLIRLGDPGDALRRLGEIRPGLEQAYGTDGVYPALALAYQGLAEHGLSAEAKAREHLSAAREVLASSDSRRRRHERLLGSIARVLSGSVRD